MDPGSGAEGSDEGNKGERGEGAGRRPFVSLSFSLSLSLSLAGVGF